MKIEKMEIEIPKDLDKFKEEIMFGLSMKQLSHVIVGSLVAFLLYGIMNLIGLHYMKEVIIIFAVTPIFVSGFFNYQGLSLKEFIVNIITFYTREQLILYKDYDIEKMLEGEAYNE